MSKPSHIPLFPDAYLRDNYRLSLEQHGLFLVLMMEAWGSEDCTLPDDEKQLAAIAGIPLVKFRKIAAPVLARWTSEGGRLHQKRLLKEWHYVREKSEKRRAAADAKWQKEKRFADANAMQMDSKCNASAMHLGGGEGGGGGSSGIGLGDSVSSEEPFA